MQISQLFMFQATHTWFIVAQVMSFGEWLSIIARSELGSDLDCSVINARSELGSDLDCYELRASSQITASSYILERHLWVYNSMILALTPTWSIACKQTDCYCGDVETAWPKLVLTCPVNTKHLYDFMQCWTNVEDVEDVGPTLYKCYTNVLCLLGRQTFSQTLYIYSMLVQCWASVADVGLALKQHWINVPFK